MVKNERENLAVYGSKKKYLALQGYTPLEALNILLNEEMLGIEEKMLPMQTSHTLSSEDEKGRPSNEDNPDSSTNTGKVRVNKMEQFVKVFAEEDKEYLVNNGYKLLNSEKNGNITIYTFKNDSNKLTFSKEDRERFLFTNILNF